MVNIIENNKYTIIKKIESGLITRKEASFELSLSLRQVDRLRKIFREQGEKGFIHKSRGKQSNNKIDKGIIEELEQLYLDEYYDFNLTAFYDELNKKKNTKANMISHIHLCIENSLMTI